MSARKCPACGKGARKWTLVFLLGAKHPRGRMGYKGSFVCAACADGGVTVVSPSLAPVVEPGNAERKNQREVLAPFIRNLEARVKARKASRPSLLDATKDDERIHNGGYTEALEDVVAMLREGRA